MISIKGLISSWNPAFILDLVFPRLCVSCNTPLTRGENALCTGCLSLLPKTHYIDPTNNPVARMFWGKFPFVMASSLLLFEKGNLTQKIIHQIKYHDHRALAITSGKLLGAYLLSFPLFNTVDAIIPVPLHKRKLRQRGFNQSVRIAEGVSRQTDIPIIEGVLVRKQYNPTQTHKGRYERWKNVSDIFCLTSTENIQGKHILLLDDVITTGATMDACAETLNGFPEIKISIASLAVSL